MPRTILIHGAIAGLILLPFELMVAFGVPGSHGMLIGYTVMLVALSTVFLGVKRWRDMEGGGVIGFGPAFGLGLAISILAGIFYVLAWELALKLSGADFITDYARQVIAQARAHGDGPERIARLTAEMAQMRTNYANPVYRLPMTFMEIAPVGLLVSLVSAGLLRNPRFMPVRRPQRMDMSPSSE